MHLSLGLGIGALSVLASPSVTPSASSSVDAFRASFAVEGDVVVEEDVHAWFGTAHVDFIGTQGEWDEEQLDEELVVLRPRGEDCSFGVRLLWSDRVIYFPMSGDAELAFSRNWIQVNQRGALLLGARAERAPGAAAAVNNCDGQWPTSMVGQILFGGDCWNEIELSDDCDFGIQCTATGDVTMGCTLRVSLVSGGTTNNMYYASGCESTLAVTDCLNASGRSVVCVVK